MEVNDCIIYVRDVRDKVDIIIFKQWSVCNKINV